MKNKLKSERIKEIICEAVTIEKKFISESLPSDLIGINSNVLFHFILVDDSIYLMRCWQTLSCFGNKKNIQHKKPIWLDGYDFPPRKN